MRELDRAARDAIHRHRDRKLKLMFEIVLGDLVELHGVKGARKILRWHYQHLAEFE